MADNTTDDRPEVLVVRDLVKHYRVHGGTVRSVDGVNLTIHRGEIVGLVGESGSGKSTIGKMVVSLIKPTAGEVEIDGVAMSKLSRRRLRRLRKRFNIVFQDPGSSINPRGTVGSAIAEPLRIHRIVPSAKVEERVHELLEQVGLRPDTAARFPHELSGGQRQRVSLARALAAGPDLLVADEPTSALDVSVQASVLNLIADLQKDLGFACLFISHDLSAIEYLADRIAVMYLGRIVEVSDRRDLFERPLHPYADVLLAAAPLADPVEQRERERIPLRGEIPSPMDPPSGCHFHPRCPLATELCRTTAPELRTVTRDSGRTSEVACHLVADDGTRPPLPVASAVA
ncbi:ABC transporter ATP-binding protein [Microbacterium sp. MYb62]|uniref:ABC transporter ATP-binding protein n=1 Tax=Microbacterium sp. MYb62 TaxID=1848690 RepID=UPI000CFB8D6E|nr:oligopeptide/dipeptide ABC transporter ATP-binding protein [Microbacterium sp. MYb62]PRB18605.1 peptide ABC transporter ATP-binding protein [Microbacterium sp. MYb62]